uniref:Uncharacterized protein n=1 Tax=Arundo donax TaxID=35708 RepID=A0A0A8ZVQ0_ARUDO
MQCPCMASEIKRKDTMQLA